MRRWLIAAAIVLLPLAISCKKEETFYEPDYIFGRWLKAVEMLNYAEYKKYEAFPKSEGVFRELYRDSYFVDLMITDVEDLDEDNVKKDIDGNPYIKRNVSFECTEVRRPDRKPMALLRGDVDFIRYTEGKREKEGWLMWNRSMVRIQR